MEHKRETDELNQRISEMEKKIDEQSRIAEKQASMRVVGIRISSKPNVLMLGKEMKLTASLITSGFLSTSTREVRRRTHRRSRAASTAAVTARIQKRATSRALAAVERTSESKRTRSTHHLADGATVSGRNEFPSPNGSRMETSHSENRYARITVL